MSPSKKTLATGKIKIKEPNIDSSPSDTDENRILKTDGQLTVDVYETDTHFVVVSAIAGVTAKDIDISVDKDMLIIKGSRQNSKSDVGKNYFYQECYWGSFSRKIILPENIDSSNPEAEFDKGLLTIKFAKNKNRV
ncbi:Hsp20/alpha crystallin family protein [Patescibacteria group bacterium]|nr:Hsp20/alpha crystallin family protein [Patescibacteria group bacterium]